MERSTFALIHLYIKMGLIVRANEPDMNFKMKMLVVSNKNKFPQIALVSAR
jgi:hypothetical protein